MSDKPIPGQMTPDECIALLQEGTDEIAAELIADVDALRGTEDAE